VAVWVYEVKHHDRDDSFVSMLSYSAHPGIFIFYSTMEKANRYSLSLPRYCFVHRNYMDWYTSDLPQNILDKIAKHLNCEDIAMSFLISSMTNGEPSLLADLWAIKSMVKLYVEEKISGSKDHKKIRDECVNSFAQQLGLKEEGAGRLRTAIYAHKEDSSFECGAIPDQVVNRPKTTRELEFDKKIKHWHSQDSKKTLKEIQKMMSIAGYEAYKHGLVEKSDKWKQRFGKPHDNAHK
jgi:hypothetical protein